MLNITFTVALLKPRVSPPPQPDCVQNLQQVVVALLSACLHLLVSWRCLRSRGASHREIESITAGSESQGPQQQQPHHPGLLQPDSTEAWWGCSTISHLPQLYWVNVLGQKKKKTPIPQGLFPFQTGSHLSTWPSVWDMCRLFSALK